MPSLARIPPLQRFHALGIGLARLVIVPQQMKRAMHDEMGDVVGRSLALRLRLSPDGLARQSRHCRRQARARAETRAIGGK